MTYRAVIYARCSTEEESQRDALIKQAGEARACVGKKGWILVDSYIESKSGTTTKGRLEYKRLYEDMLTEKFDIIVIKSQDRLMRNTKDWYLFVDRLLKEQKRLYLYLEQKFYSADDALVTGIRAILAEEYSRELSRKINNAHRNRQKTGGAVILTSRTYGYRKGPDKSVEIVEEEAEVKRKMYELCAAGYGSRTIAAILKREGILNRNGNPFADSDILRMIRNPLHKGTAVMHRRHYDFETKKTVKIPREEQDWHENKVPAIVSEELWEKANREIDRRSEYLYGKDGPKRGRNPGKYPLSGKICCGLCGKPYYRRVRKRDKEGAAVYEWKCKRYLEEGRKRERHGKETAEENIPENAEGCDNVHLEEEKLYRFLEKFCREKYGPDEEKLTGSLLEMIKDILKEKDGQTELKKEKEKQETLERRMNILLDKLLKGTVSDRAYQKKQEELEKEAARIGEKIKELEKQQPGNDVLAERLEQMETAVRKGRMPEQAEMADMLDRVWKIHVYPSCLELYFAFSGETDEKTKEPAYGALKEVIRLEYGALFSYADKKRKEREAVRELMKKTPDITAKKIAEELGISLSGANYRIRVLKKEGKIRFDGKGGKGKWEVIQPEADDSVS